MRSNPPMPATVTASLKVTADDQEAERYRKGHGDGIVWAREYATCDELRDLVENFEPGQGDDFDSGHSLCDFANDQEHLKAVSVPHYDDPFWRGFLAGAEEVMAAEPPSRRRWSSDG
jgi:hypothetical protein